MTLFEVEKASTPKIDAAELSRKLGLKPADERPILKGWREANNAWRRARLERIADRARQVQAHVQRYKPRELTLTALSRRAMGRKRPVWCVELRRHFPTLTAAATFVGRKPSNISQSLTRGVRSGGYHWEQFDPSRHGATS